MFIALLLTATVAVLIGRRILCRKRSGLQRIKAGVAGLLVLNGLMMLAAGVVLVKETPVFAESKPAAEKSGTSDASNGFSDLAAAIAIGVATIGAGIAVAVTGSAAIGGISQNPDIFGRSLVFVGLAEGIAIYGLIVAFMILTA